MLRTMLNVVNTRHIPPDSASSLSQHQPGTRWGVLMSKSARWATFLKSNSCTATYTPPTRLAIVVKPTCFKFSKHTCRSAHFLHRSGWWRSGSGFFCSCNQVAIWWRLHDNYVSVARSHGRKQAMHSFLLLNIVFNVMHARHNFYLTLVLGMNQYLGVNTYSSERIPQTALDFYTA